MRGKCQYGRAQGSRKTSCWCRARHPVFNFSRQPFQLLSFDTNIQGGALQTSCLLELHPTVLFDDKNYVKFTASSLYTTVLFLFVNITHKVF